MAFGEEVVAKWKREGRTEIDMRHKRRSALPGSIGCLVNLITLKLSYNRLERLPRENRESDQPDNPPRQSQPTPCTAQGYRQSGQPRGSYVKQQPTQ